MKLRDPAEHAVAAADFAVEEEGAVVGAAFDLDAAEAGERLDGSAEIENVGDARIGIAPARG